ncbi:alpha/beta hydrolase [Flavivirga sp. 57AJ16]|uniref:alpha/beta hydrolase n=1 Tax=Flavivirga sp. 57AJ16 TaxID=3025307 RepID=UPI00236565E2|nr:alpha/beta hydrolase [Flavivirga sp. 57AJ16]MDD7887514.1 alpha/beta hydrolase [Flavivirga sp. 57AJ16]
MKTLVLLSIFSLYGFVSVYGQEKKYKPVTYPASYDAQIDVVYTVVDGWEGRMDLYTNPNSSTPTPVVMNIHGGGWNHGVKESQTGYGSFFKNGYAVANVEYRLVDVSPAPGAVQDVRCALIYLFKHAKELNIDTNKIVVMGGSSGGHLALMAGLLANNKEFDTNCPYNGEIKVAAIIDKYGVTDLLPLSYWKSAKRWLGDGFGDEVFIKSVSPLYYVNHKSPPIFIIHGDDDPTVPYQQSKALYDKLLEYDVKVDFLTIPGGKHGGLTKEEKSLFSKRMWTFLDDLGLIPIMN